MRVETPMTHPPLELIDAARTGGQSDIDRLIEAIWPDTYRLARGILDDSHIAEDAAQDACAIVYRTISSLREAAAFRVWLYRIVEREAKQRARRQSVAVRRIPMQSDISDALLDARRRIVVPPVPLVRIRAAASAHRTTPTRPRGWGFVAALMTGAAVVLVVTVGISACSRAGAGAGAQKILRVSFPDTDTPGLANWGDGTSTVPWKNVHVSFSPSGGSAIMAETIESRLSPTMEQVHAVARRANFPVILPAGLPGDDLPLQIYTMQMKTGGQRVIVLTYRLPGAWRRQHHLLSIILASPEMLVGSAEATSGPPTAQPSGAAGKGDILWKIGQEYVIVPQSAATPAELEKIHRAMLAQIRP
jgi:RNA polymerase sigma factor (sigma-70 family)